MLMNHADAGLEGCSRIAWRQAGAESFHRSRVGHVMAEQDVHQRGLAGTVFPEQSDDLAFRQIEGDIVIGDKIAEGNRDAVEAEHRLRPGGTARFHQVDFGSSSLISTTKLPALMAASRSATSFIAASGILPSKVPSGASEQPPSFMKE